MSAVLLALLGGLVGIVLAGVFGNEAYELVPWLTSKIVKLAVRLDANDPDEIDDLYAEHMDGIKERPGHLTGLTIALGLLFKVAIARRLCGAVIGSCGRIYAQLILLLARRRAGPNGPRKHVVALRARPGLLVRLPIALVRLLLTHKSLKSGYDTDNATPDEMGLLLIENVEGYLHPPYVHIVVVGEGAIETSNLSRLIFGRPSVAMDDEPRIFLSGPEADDPGADRGEGSSPMPPAAD